MSKLVNLDEDKSDNNIKLIYDYAEKSLEKLNSSQNTVNTKLGFILSFDAAYGRFALDLPDHIIFRTIFNVNICLDSLFKIFTYLFLLLSIGLCIWGFKPVERGEIVLPEELMEKCLDISEDLYRKSMINSWNKSVKELACARDNKAAILNRAVIYLGLAAICSIIDILLVLIFQ